MALSNHERVGKALELLNAGLKPFFARELHSAYGDSWDDAVRSHLSDRQGGRSNNWDTTAMLGVIIGQWDQVFRRQLGPADRTLVHECRDIRNRRANLQYGRMSVLLRRVLGYWSDGGAASYVVSRFIPPGAVGNPEWLFVMHDEVVQALTDLGWFDHWEHEEAQEHGGDHVV